MTAEPLDPPPDCAACERLVAFRERNRAARPDWFNAPVPAFGPVEAAVLVVGLAPGLQGANRTGRPFTGDYAGDTLYPALIGAGLADGRYDARPDDDVVMTEARVTNAVRCVPPENKPMGAEIRTCGAYLAREMAAMPRLAAVLALGRVAHNAVLGAVRVRQADCPFAHGARHALPTGPALVDSYHCSRYNTNTGRLTPAMFRAAIDTARAAAG